MRTKSYWPLTLLCLTLPLAIVAAGCGHKAPRAATDAQQSLKNVLNPADYEIVRYELWELVSSELRENTTAPPKYQYDWLLATIYTSPYEASTDDERAYYKRGANLSLSLRHSLDPNDPDYDQGVENLYWVCNETVMSQVRLGDSIDKMRRLVVDNCQEMIMRLVAAADRRGPRATMTPSLDRRWNRSREAQREPAFDVSITALGPDKPYAIFKLCLIDGQLQVTSDASTPERRAYLTAHDRLMSSADYESTMGPIFSLMADPISKAHQALRKKEYAAARAYAQTAINALYIGIEEAGIALLWDKSKRSPTRASTISVPLN